MRTVGVKLLADVSAYVSGIKRAGMATKDFVGELDKAAQAGQLDAVADRAGMAGLAIAGIAGYAVKANADFEKAMSGVQAATHASAGEIDALKQAALEAGKSTSYSATEAAGAITELSKAGVATADVLGGGLSGALNLAAAGQLDVAEAAETAASAMTQFKLKGKDVPHIADLLAAAAGKAQGSVHDMGMALNQTGLVAAQMGLTIEDTVGTLGSFASAGLLGSDAGTSLKTAMLMLANPTDKAKGLMEDLGIQVYDAQGKFVGITKLAGSLKTQLSTLTQEQRNSALATIFGSDAIRAASILYEQGEQGIQGWIDKVNDSGYAAETAKTMTDNLIGDLERLKGSLETLAIESGEGGAGGLRLITKALNELVDQFAEMPTWLSNSVVALGGLAGAGLLVGAGMLKARRTSAELREELTNMGPTGERAARGLQRVGSAATKAGLAFVALELAGTVINQFQKDLNPQVEAMATGLQRYAETGELAGESSRVLGDNLEDLKVGFEFLADEDNNRRQAVKNMQDGLEGLIPGLDGTATSLTKTRERVEAMDAALASLVQGGKAEAANDVFQKLAQELATGGVTMEEFKKQFPSYAAALETAAGATGGLADATANIPGPMADATRETKEYKTAAESAAGAADGHREALVQLADQMKAEADPVFGLLASQRDLTEAQTAAATAVKKHGRNSIEAKEATVNLALAAIDLQGKVGALGSTFDGKLSPSLRQTLLNAGLTERQIGDVEKQFGEAKKAADSYAGNYKANVSAPGAATARKQIRDLKGELASMKTKWTVTIKQNFLTFGKPYSPDGVARGQVGGLAYGGPVTGPGPKGKDSEIRMLAPGEHVWTAREVDAVGGHAAMMRLRREAVGSGPMRTATPVSQSTVMRAPASTTQTIIHEHRIVLEGRGTLGTQIVKEMRTSAGLTATMKQHLGLAAS
ncbi:phage tail tape measure protein [Actinoplanes solisilvae]|uniref:phage tail tape measure protein n=1 Tax=Actinoplanes solisilvae TaxID=2486853 RepID=UPI000FD7FCB2|nr:phage tail tape measure protein [Actinoplanes solisilvae]